jgi:AraC-like DNA-binding protein
MMNATNSTEQEQARLWRAHDLGNLEVLQASYTKHSFARHTHEEFMIGVIEGGGCEFYYRGDTHIALAGSIVLINPGEVHDGSGAETARLVYRALYPAVDVLQRIASEFAGKHQGVPYFTTPVVQDDQANALLRSLHALLETPASALERESQFCLVFAQLIARYAEKRPQARRVGKEHQAVRLIREYLEAQYAEQVTLAQLASLANLSSYHLLRVVHAELGLPPHAYLTQVRITQAKKLLRLGVPIPQAALETGFVDQSHLTRHFKRQVGVTPGQYALGSKNVQDGSARIFYTQSRG